LIDSTFVALIFSAVHLRGDCDEHISNIHKKSPAAFTRQPLANVIAGSSDANLQIQDSVQIARP
jgi:hypothetical protein